MKPEKQRIAIADYCGWKNCRIESLAGQNRMLGKCPFDFTDNVGFAVPSDYLNSLDAMHEAESHIKDKSLYCRFLWLVALNDPSNTLNEPAFTTAAQRAEAFLRTVGRWEE
jgi:hypothetical protein